MNKLWTGRSLLFATILTVLVAMPAMGQFRVGLVGGANFSSLNEMRAGESLVNFDNAAAYHVGVFVDLKLGAVGIRPAVYYLNAGSIFQGASFLSEDKFDTVYITIPVDLVYTLGIGPLKPYLFAGPEFRLLNSTDAPLDLEENIRTFVMNGSVGAGIEIGVPATSLTLLPHLRYSFGLSSITDKTYTVEGVVVETNGDARVKGWLLSLGVAF